MAGRWGMANHVSKRKASGTFEIRYPIPADLQALFPKTKGSGFLSHWIQSLGTKDRAQANRTGEVLALIYRGYVGWLEGDDLAEFKIALRSQYSTITENLREAFSDRARINALVEQLEKEGVPKAEAMGQVLAMVRRGLQQEEGINLDDLPTTAHLISLISALRRPDSPEFIEYAYGFLRHVLLTLLLKPPALNERHDPFLAMLLGAGETFRCILEFELALRTNMIDGFSPDVEYLRGSEDINQTHFPAPQQNLKPPQTVADRSPKLGEFFAYYEGKIAAMAHPIAPKTLDKRRWSWLAFANWVGEERTLASLSKEDMWNFHDALIDGPRNAGARSDLKDLSFKELVALGWKYPDRYAKRTQQTIDSQLSQVRTVLELAVKRGLIPNNPATGVSATGGEASTGVRALSTDELNRLLAHPLFAETPASIRDDEFWVPLLQLFTGCRLSELAMPLCDVVTDEHTVSYLRISPNEDRRLKNDGSQRIIPIHPDLEAIGFLDYVRTMRERNESKLFPLWVKPTRGGGVGTYDQSPRRRRFNQTILKEAGVTASDVSARSFRKNFEQFITEGGVQDRIALRLQGRKMGTSADHYLPKGLNPTILFEHLSACSYAGLNLDRLRV